MLQKVHNLDIYCQKTRKFYRNWYNMRGKGKKIVEKAKKLYFSIPFLQIDPCSQVWTWWKFKHMFFVRRDINLCVKMPMSGLTKKWNYWFSHYKMVNDVKTQIFFSPDSDFHIIRFSVMWKNSNSQLVI